MNLLFSKVFELSVATRTWIHVLLLTCPLTALASEIILEDVLESVQRNYPLILQTKQDALKSEGDLLTAQGGFDPVLKAISNNVPFGYYRHDYYDISLEQPTALWGSRISGGWRGGTGRFPFYEGKLATFTDGEVRLGLEIPLLRNGAIDERRNKIFFAENGIGVTQAANSLVGLDVVRLASYRYWDWLAAGKKLVIAENLFELASERDKGFLHRYQKGDASQFEYRENQRMLIQRRSLLLAADRLFNKSVFELSLYYRDAEGNPLLLKRSQVPQDFPKFDSSFEEKEREKVKTEILTLVDGHPEVQRLQFQMNQNQNDLKLSRNYLLPRLDFQLGYAVDLGQAPKPESSSSYSLQPLANSPGEFKVAITFELPVLLRTARGQTHSIQASYNRLEDQSILARNRIQTTIFDSLQAMEVSRQRSELAGKELELAKQLEEGEKIRNRQGDSQLFMVNLREQARGEAATREVDTLADYYRAKADYLAVITR